MAANVQTFPRRSLPAGFGGQGSVTLVDTFNWGWTAKDRRNVDPGITVLPQTSGYFCLIDDPRCNANGVRRTAGVAFPDGQGRPEFFVDHGDGTVTYSNRGARLFWANVHVPPGGKVQFHYIFLRGQWNNPFNAFAQFLAVAPNGEVARKSTFAQTRQPGPVESGQYYRWRAHEPIAFPDGFDGTLQWVVSNGERRNKGDFFNVHPDTDLYPSALAVDFISII